MKRRRKTIGRILQWMTENRISDMFLRVDEHSWGNPSVIDGLTNRELKQYVELMVEGELLGYSDPDARRSQVDRITWKGYDFLEECERWYS